MKGYSPTQTPLYFHSGAAQILCGHTGPCAPSVLFTVTQSRVGPPGSFSALAVTKNEGRRPAVVPSEGQSRGDPIPNHTGSPF